MLKNNKKGPVCIKFISDVQRAKILMDPRISTDLIALQNRKLSKLDEMHRLCFRYNSK